MVNTVSGTYSSDNPYQKKLDETVSQVGTNPEAVRQALADKAISSDTKLQEGIQGQKTGLSAIEQLSNFDQQLAGQYQQTNQQQMAADTARRAQTTQMGAFNPNNAQATIASGPANFDVNQMAQTAVVPGIISPFVQAGLVSGQQQAAQGVFDMASAQRASRERVIGSEIENMVKLFSAQQQAEQAKREAEEARKQADFERQYNYAKEVGGVVRDPISGQEYKFETPEEKMLQESRMKQLATPEMTIFDSLKQRQGKSGDTILNEVISGSKPFLTIVRENPDLSQDQLYELARINSQAFGAFKESPEELRAMGLSPEIMDKIGIPRASGATSDPNVQGYIDLIQKGDMNITNVPAELRTQVVNALSASGGTQPKENVVMGLKDRYNLTTDDSKKVMDAIRLIGALKGVEGSLRNAIGGKTTGRVRDIGIGATGPLSQFAGTGGSDAGSKARAAINDLQAQIRNNMFGSALSEQEIKQANKILPTAGTQEQDNLNRLSSKTNQKINDVRSTLRAYGVSDAEIDAMLASTTAPSTSSPATNNAGTIRVKLKSSGKTGSVPAGEFDENLYERI